MNNTRVCPQCGAKKPSYYAKQCRACWLKAKIVTPLCSDCGYPLDSKRNTRCRPCFRAFKEAQRASGCSKEGCAKPPYAKGLCRDHYQVGWRASQKGTLIFDSASHAKVRELPCAACGYNRMKSEVHRIIAQGAYIVGNMTPLCARCHDEVERGLTACPPAWQPETVPVAVRAEVRKTPSRYGGVCEQCGAVGIRSVAKICRPCFETRKRAVHQFHS
jgi:hypothetical protein